MHGTGTRGTFTARVSGKMQVFVSTHHRPIRDDTRDGYHLKKRRITGRTPRSEVSRSPKCRDRSDHGQQQLSFLLFCFQL